MHPDESVDFPLAGEGDDRARYEAQEAPLTWWRCTVHVEPWVVTVQAATEAEAKRLALLVGSRPPLVTVLRCLNQEGPA